MATEINSFGISDYCQYLLSSQDNFTITNLATHLQTFSHDVINSFLRSAEITPSVLWSNVESLVITSKNGYIIFDDTVLDKNYSEKIELVRKQYSGNAGKVIRGIGLVTCIYYNPDIDQFYVIDFRIFDKEGDGKNKHEHVRDMLGEVFDNKKLLFGTVLMDCWYATKDLMQYIDESQKIYYCPIRKNRLIKVSDLTWEGKEEYKVVYLKSFAPHKKVKLFSVNVSNNNTEYIVTNDTKPVSKEEVKQEYGRRWKTEQFYRELKQTTGIESCQCRRYNAIILLVLCWRGQG